jgi:hypothetical protein
LITLLDLDADSVSARTQQSDLPPTFFAGSYHMGLANVTDILKAITHHARHWLPRVLLFQVAMFLLLRYRATSRQGASSLAVLIVRFGSRAVTEQRRWYKPPAASDQAVDPATAQTSGSISRPHLGHQFSRHLGSSPRVRGTHWRWWARDRQRRRSRVLAAAVTAVFRRDSVNDACAHCPHCGKSSIGEMGSERVVRLGRRARTLCWRPIHIELQCRVDQTVHRRRDTVQPNSTTLPAAEVSTWVVVDGAGRVRTRR